MQQALIKPARLTCSYCHTVQELMSPRKQNWISKQFIPFLSILLISTKYKATEIESRWGWDFPPVQTGPGAHPASCKMGTGSFPVVKCSRGVLLTTHPLLVSRSWKSRAIPLPTLWATPGLWWDHFTFTFTFARPLYHLFTYCLFLVWQPPGGPRPPHYWGL